MKVRYTIWGKKSNGVDLIYQDAHNVKRIVEVGRKDFPIVGDRYNAIIDALVEVSQYTEHFIVHSICFDSNCGVYDIELTIDE